MGRQPRLPAVRDDFVRVPLPQVAAGGGAARLAAEGLRAYEQEAKIVDARLFRKVDLHLKGAALEEFCAEVKRQTGVDLRVRPGVGDEKATVFVKEQPARDVMRAVARLFGYFWARTGEEGKYRYELIQDLKTQLAEEELRNRDLHAAMLRLDTEMAAFRPYLEKSVLELEKLVPQLPREERNRVWPIAFNGGWGGIQLYHRLTPAQRRALLSGQDIVLRPDAPRPEERVPEDWVPFLVQSLGDSRWQRRDGSTVVARDTPGSGVAQVRIRLERAELGEVSLQSYLTVTVPIDGDETLPQRAFRDCQVGTGRGPSVGDSPRNAEANVALRSQAAFRQRVSLAPESSCLRASEPQLSESEAPSFRPGDVEKPHLFSADAWEAVHRATGRSIIADFASRVTPTAKVTVKDATLFDALCRVGDATRMRWRVDGDFILARSTSYFWDKLREVPNRLLARWRAQRQLPGGLPLESLMEMASLPEEPLSSTGVSQAIVHCLGVPEWRLVGDLTPTTRAQWARGGARLLSELTPHQRQRVFTPDGLPFRDLAPDQQREAWGLQQVMTLMRERQDGTRNGLDLANAYVVGKYVPAGWYAWERPMVIRTATMPPRMIAARTAEDALAAARRVYPPAAAEEVAFKRLGWFHVGFEHRFDAQGRPR